jgi:uncharacterized membrane protein YhhN
MGGGQRAQKGGGVASSGTAAATRTRDIAAGQRLIIAALLLNIASAVLQLTLGDAAFAVGLLSAVLATVGLVRLGRGLGYSIPRRIVLIVLASIPLVGLITLLILNAKATKALRGSGISVGLFGARGSGGTDNP